MERQQWASPVPGPIEGTLLRRYWHQNACAGPEASEIVQTLGEKAAAFEHRSNASHIVAGAYLARGVLRVETAVSGLVVR